MLTSPQTEAVVATARVCPLDGHPVESGPDEFVTCTGCREMLTTSETVERATPETWAAYLAVGATDTGPEDAPLAKLGAS